MSKTIIRCPLCKGTNLTILEETTRNKSYVIKDNELYNNSDGMERFTGKIIMLCRDCSQKEDIEDASWKPTKEEKEIIYLMLSISRSADISEYME